MRTQLISGVFILLSIVLLACDSGGDTKALRDAIKRNKLNINSITVVATKTLTIEDNDGICDAQNACNTYLPTNKTETFKAYGVSSDNQSYDLSADVDWSTSDTSKAQVDQSGNLTTQAVLGDVNVIAQFSGIQGAATVTVSSAELTSGDIIFRQNDSDISPSPAMTDVTVCSVFSLKIIGDFGDSRRIITHNVAWNIQTGAADTDNAKVVLNSSNLAEFSSHSIAVYAVQAAYTNISNETVNASRDFNVVQGDVVAITITPNTPHTMTQNTTDQFNAATTIGGASVDVTNTANWQSDTETVAVVTNGLVLAEGVGEAILTASCGNASQTANVTVEQDQDVSSIKIKDASTHNTITLLELDLNGANNNNYRDLEVEATYTNQNTGDITADVTTEVMAIDGDNTNKPVTVELTSEDKLRVTANRIGGAVLTVKFSGKDDTLSINVK